MNHLESSTSEDAINNFYESTEVSPAKKLSLTEQSDLFDQCMNDIENLLLRAVRCSLYELIGSMPQSFVTVAPGFLNALNIPSPHENDLLDAWSDEMTEKWGFQPYNVVRYYHDPYDEDVSDENCGTLTCNIFFRTVDRLNQPFLNSGFSKPYFVANLYCEEDGFPRSLYQRSLDQFQWAEFEGNSLAEQLTRAGWQNVWEKFQRELLFPLLTYTHLSFEWY